MNTSELVAIEYLSGAVCARGLHIAPYLLGVSREIGVVVEQNVSFVYRIMVDRAFHRNGSCMWKWLEPDFADFIEHDTCTFGAGMDGRLIPLKVRSVPLECWARALPEVKVFPVHLVPKLAGKIVELQGRW